MTSKKPEKVEEKKFVARCKSHGWPCIKLATQGPFGETGYNDRAVFAPYGTVMLFEFKRDGEGAEKKRAENIQEYRHENFEKLGHKTNVVYTSDEAYSILVAAIRDARIKAEKDKDKTGRRHPS